jgi:hypothetical protein
MTEEQTGRQDERPVAELAKEIFEVFKRVDPPLGVAAQATTIVLVQIALKAGVTRHDLVRSVEKVWRATTAHRGKRN